MILFYIYFIIKKLTPKFLTTFIYLNQTYKKTYLQENLLTTQ